VALEAARAETRRKRREEAIVDMIADEEVSPEELWKEVSPRIDAAMEELTEADRAAVLLRFFHGRSLRELAVILGVNEEAAKKRVSRAMQRLGQVLSRHGIKSSSSILGAALTAFSIQAGPSALGGVISSAIAHGSIASAEILGKAAMQVIMWTKIKMTAACAVAALCLTATVTISVQCAKAAREHSRLEIKAAEVRQRASVRADREREALRVAEEENRALQLEAQQVHRLRNTVAQLQTKRSIGASEARALPLRSAPPALRGSAETLRELQFEEFVAAGRKALEIQPLTEAEFPTPEYIQEIDFFKNLGLAIRVYASNHHDEFPQSLDQLLETDMVNDATKKKIREGRYEYHVFSEAEKKPELPAVWWAAPDERGIRMLVLNDGSVHRIREPAGVQLPGYLALGGAK
jgi:hypothetical protein